MESTDACDDDVTALDEGSGRKKRVQHEGGRSDGRRGIDLTGPGTEAGVGNRTAMMMARGLQLEMFDRTGHGKDGQDQIGPGEEGREAGERSLRAAHSVIPCSR